MFNNQLIKTSDVNRIAAALRSTLRSNFSDLSVEEGSNLNDLVVRPMAYLAALVKTQADEIRTRLSIEGIKSTESSEAFAMLQDLASNFLVFPRDAIPAKGIVSFKFSTKTTRTIPSSIILTRGDGDIALKPFSTESDITVTLDDYLEVEEQGTTYYVFNSLFESLNTRTNFIIDSGSLDSSIVLSNLVSIENKAPFIGREPSEFRQADLEQRMKLALTSRGFSSDKAIRATLLEEGISNLKDSIGIGAGDREMKRDIIPSTISASEFHSLGMVNIVLKSLAELEEASISSSYLPTKPILSTVSLTRAGTNLPIVSFFDYDTSNKVRVVRSYNSSTGATTCTSGLVAATTGLVSGEVRLSTVADSSTFKNGVEEQNKFLITKFGSETNPTTGSFRVDNNLKVVQELVDSSEYNTLANNTLVIAATQVQVLIPKIRITASVGIEKESIPVVTVKSRLASVINEWSATVCLSTLDLLTPISLTLLGTATNIEFPEGVKYIVYLPNGKEVLYTTTSKLSVEDVTLQSVANTTTLSYLEDLQISDRVLSYFIETSDISVEVL